MALVVTLKVMPSSGKSGCQLDKNGSLKFFLKSAAENGKANSELIKIISHVLKVPIASVEIISGATTRKKLVKIHTALTFDKFLNMFGIESVQQKIG